MRTRIVGANVHSNDNYRDGPGTDPYKPPESQQLPQQQRVGCLASLWWLLGRVVLGVLIGASLGIVMITLLVAVLT